MNCTWLNCRKLSKNNELFALIMGIFFLEINLKESQKTKNRYRVSYLALPRHAKKELKIVRLSLKLDVLAWVALKPSWLWVIPAGTNRTYPNKNILFKKVKFFKKGKNVQYWPTYILVEKCIISPFRHINLFSSVCLQCREFFSISLHRSHTGASVCFGGGGEGHVLCKCLCTLALCHA
jgi:hypothetical protein